MEWSRSMKWSRSVWGVGERGLEVCSEFVAKNLHLQVLTTFRPSWWCNIYHASFNSHHAQFANLWALGNIWALCLWIAHTYSHSGVDKYIQFANAK
jgi:hypothetical protein